MNEIEAKFYVADHVELTAELQRRGASLTHERHLERNWRFDRPDRSLSQAGMVFRLRVDPRATLTVKQPQGSDLKRREYQLEVDDSRAALRMVEALGYETLAIYEKYRTVYSLARVEVMLDELPFGNFVELEAPSVSAIERLAAELGLDWSLRVPGSYLDLFDRLRSQLRLEFRDASFVNFEAAPEVTAEQLGLADAFAHAEPG